MSEKKACAHCGKEYTAKGIKRHETSCVKKVVAGSLSTRTSPIFTKSTSSRDDCAALTQCDYCHQEYTAKGLKKHARTCPDKPPGVVDLLVASEFVCTKCNQAFARRAELNRHTNGKYECVRAKPPSPTALDQVQVDSSTIRDAKYVESKIMTCLDCLRGVGITGHIALKNIVTLLALKLCEPHFASGRITFNEEDFADDGAFIKRCPRFRTFLFSELKTHGDTMCYDMRAQIAGVLKALGKHKKLGGVFSPGSITIREEDNVTICTLLEHIGSINTDANTDIIGDGYELVLKRFGESKDFAQYFTPQWLRKMLVQYVKPQSGQTVHDPACGTGGFLLSAIEYVKDHGGQVRVDGISGQDVQGDVLLNATTNILAKTGDFPSGLIRADTLRTSSQVKYDVVLSNPPFGLKGVKWEDTPSGDPQREDYAADYIPIKTNNSTAMFMQVALGRVKVGGKLAIVLPAGQEMESTGSALPDVRRLLLTAGRLTDYIALPRGTFPTASGLNACVLVFEKVSEYAGLVEVKKTAKRVSPKFTGAVPDYSVCFWRVDEPGGNAVKVVDVMTSEMGESYKLVPHSAKMSEPPTEGEFMRLGDITTVKAGKPLTKKDFGQGDYPVIGGGTKPIGTHSEYNVEPHTILISKDGAGAGQVSRYPVRAFATSSCIALEQRDGYLYCVLKYHMKERISALQKGAAQPHVYWSDLENLMIPWPEEEERQRVQGECLYLEERLKQTKQRRKDYERDLDFVGRRVNASTTVRLGDLVEARNGKALIEKDTTEGINPVIGGGSKPFGHHGEYNTDANTILISKDGAGAGFVSRYSVPVFATASCLRLDSKDDYLYLMLKYGMKSAIRSLQKGAAQPHVYWSDLRELSVPWPSDEERAEYVRRTQLQLRELDMALFSINNEEDRIREQMAELFGGEPYGREMPSTVEEARKARIGGYYYGPELGSRVEVLERVEDDGKTVALHYVGGLRHSVG